MVPGAAGAIRRGRRACRAPRARRALEARDGALERARRARSSLTQLSCSSIAWASTARSASSASVGAADGGSVEPPVASRPRARRAGGCRRRASRRQARLDRRVVDDAVARRRQRRPRRPSRATAASCAAEPMCSALARPAARASGTCPPSCAALRSGKWSTSNGSHSRMSGSAAPTRRGCPALTTTSGCARCAIFTCAWYGLVRSAAGRHADGHALGERLAVVRRRTKLPPQAADDAEARRDRRERRRGATPSRGHQNSSASPLITQSAPCSVAARRAMRVTHSACRSSSRSSRRTRRRRPSRS